MLGGWGGGGSNGLRRKGEGGMEGKFGGAR